MKDLETVFKEFQNQVEEISSHAQQVQDLVFRAHLKNGTSFRFTYDAERFAKQQGERIHAHPLSVFNGILDIVAALLAITLLVVQLSLDFENIFLLLCFASFILTFSLSSLFHFFEPDTRSHLVFLNLREIAKLMSLFLVNISIAYSFAPLSLIGVRSISLLLVAASLLLLSGRTQLSQRVSYLLSSLLPFVSLLSQIGMESLLRVFVFSFWSLVALLFKKESRMHSSSIFALIGLVLFTFELRMI
ncbi:MAG: hypothetical protein EOM01_07860 [Spirochaetia bacterium]|nr:hypothetical protein [Spirochaetia bacterium]